MKYFENRKAPKVEEAAPVAEAAQETAVETAALEAAEEVAPAEEAIEPQQPAGEEENV